MTIGFRTPFKKEEMELQDVLVHFQWIFYGFKFGGARLCYGTKSERFQVP